MTKLLEQALPPAVGAILSRLEGAGFEAYAVGGCVRSVLMGRAVNDWDLCSAASPQQLMELFHDCRCIPTGLEHGTVTLLWERAAYEITMFRTESDYDGRRPGTVRPARTIEEDLRRRDFTVNAMAYSPFHGLLDPYGGQADLEQGMLRAVGAAEERFREDYLRILRGLRFAAVCGFSVEEDTAKAMFACAEGMKLLSGERVWQELKKLLDGDWVGAVLGEFSPLLRHLGKEWSHFSLTKEQGQRLDALPKIPACRLAFLLEGLGEKKAAALEELRCTRELKGQVACFWERATALENGDRLELWLSRFPKPWRKDGAVSALWLGEREELLPQILSILDGQTPLDIGDLAIGGRELLALGIRGKELGETLRRLLEAVWAGEVSNEDSALLDSAMRLRR